VGSSDLALFNLTSDLNIWLNSNPTASRETLQAIDMLYTRLLGDVLGIRLDDLADDLGAGLAPDLIGLLIDLRAELRKAKQYALADQVRDRLTLLGVQLRDGPQGTTWTLS